MKKLFALTLGLAALAACNKNAVEPATPGTPIRFAVSGEYTFTKATEAALEDDDAIQIIAGAPVDAAAKAPVNGTALDMTTKLYWAPGQTATTDFVAIYPYTSNTATTIDYDLSNGDYAYHKLFMTAHVASAPTDQSVVLPFKHPFSKVLVNITNNLGSDEVETVKVKGVKMAASLNLVAGTVDLGNATAVDVDATKVADNSYGIIVMPQSAQPTIEVTTHLGSVYTFALTAAFNFEAGKVATASLTLDSQAGGGQTQGDVIGFGFSVTDWAAVATNPSFGQDNVTMGEYWYAIGCVYTDDNTVAAWSKDFPMTYKGQTSDGDEIWEITINYDESMATDDGSKGFKLRKFSDSTADKWANQLGMWNSDTNDYIDIDYGYGLATSSDVNKNIRFATSGSYTLSLLGKYLNVQKNN